VRPQLWREGGEGVTRLGEAAAMEGGSEGGRGGSFSFLQLLKSRQEGCYGVLERRWVLGAGRCSPAYIGFEAG